MENLIKRRPQTIRLRSTDVLADLREDAKMPRRIPLSSRPLDFLYFVFILVRIRPAEMVAEIFEESQRIVGIDPHTLHGAT